MRLLFVLLVSVFLASCLPNETLPKTYGVFVEVNGQWRPIFEGDVGVEVQRGADLRVLIHQKSVDLYMRSFELAKAVYVRNAIQRDPDQSPRESKPYNKWEKPKRYFVMKGQFSPVKGQPEMVIWAPVAPLPSGAYEMSVLDWRGVFIGVDRNAVLSNLEGSDLCFDLIKTNFGGIPMGAPDEYIPCSKVGDIDRLEGARQKLAELVARSGSTLPESGRESLRNIIEGSGNPNLQIGGSTLLAYAAQSGFLDLMELLFLRGVDVNFGGEDGTPLHWAVAAGKYEAALLLIRRGADVTIPKSGGWTPIDVVGYLDEDDPRTKELRAALLAKGAVPKR